MTARKRSLTRKSGTQTKWVVDILLRHPDGTSERFRKLSPVQTKRGAEQYDREVREFLTAQWSARHKRSERRHFARQNVQEGKSKKRTPTLVKFAEEFIAVYARSNNKPSEVSGKEMVFKNHLLPAFGTKTLDAISVRDIESLKATKLGQGLAPKTINNMLAVLGKALKTAKEWMLLETVPNIRFLKLPILEHSFLSIEEGNRLIAAMKSVQSRAMVTVALRTGLRLGELRALRWQDVDFENARLTVRRAAWQDQVGVPKSGRARNVALSGQAIEALHALRRRGDSATVFCDAEGQMITKGACKWPLWKGCDAAGLSKRLGWHVLRHTFASHLAMRGVSLKIIQELLGHSDMKMTMRYAHLTPQVRDAAVQLLDSV